MDYATEYHIGNVHHPRTAKATEAAPPIGRVRRVDATPQRRRRSKQRQTEIRTRGNAADGFLKCTFLPKLRVDETARACKKSEDTERDFYQSLSLLAKHYGIEPMQTRQFPQPYNMALAISDMEEKLKQQVLGFQRIGVVQENGKIFLLSEERHNTGTTLYYIPVLPLFKMLKDPKRKKAAQLLVSVCSYLYHITDIPYYRQECSYLFWMYEMHRDWVEQDEETEDTHVYLRELSKAGLIGDLVEQKLYNRMNLQWFGQRLDRFESGDAFDRDCLMVGRNALALYTDYPSASIFRNAPMHKQEPYDVDYADETIGMEKYISFISDTEGWLYECIQDSINTEFNEYGALEVPTICKRFDGSDITTVNLDFEFRLFALLDDLCTVLYNYER